MKENKLDDYINHWKIYECFDTDMSQYMTLKHFEKGDSIIRAGDAMHHFYFVVEGQVKIYKNVENGKSLLLRMPKAPTELGSLELLNDKPYVDSCVDALDHVVVIRISFEDLKHHALQDITFLKYIIHKLSHKLKTASNTASINITNPFKNRFASYLISVYNATSPEDVDDIKIEKMTDLAHFLGTSYRHLNRVVKELESDRIIKKNKKGFTILDYVKLKELSGGFYE
jgi:CRP-like cAMP-binding protein